MARCFFSFFPAKFRRTSSPLLFISRFSSAPPTTSTIHQISKPQSFPPIGRASLHDSDSDADDVRPTNKPDADRKRYWPLIDRFLQLVRESRELSSIEDAVSSLRASGFRVEEEGLVCEGMWELREEWKAAFLGFRWAVDCGAGTERSWNLMVWVLGRHKRFGLAWQLVREMHRLGMETRSALLTLIKRYAAVNEAQKAIKSFHAMDSFKVTVDSSAFYTLLSALCKHKNIEEAEELMFLNKKLYPLEAASFNIILNGWCNVLVDVLEAKRIWREMSNCCILPDGTSYTLMICCFSRVGNLFDSLRLYDEMRKRGWLPGLVVYNSLIYVLTMENCLKEAFHMLNKIEEEGLQPNEDSYNSIIQPLCMSNKVQDAESLLEEMVGKGIKLNADAYSYIISALSEMNKSKEAQNLLNRMIERGVKPPISIFHEIIKGENLNGSLKLMNQMREVGSGPNNHTFLLLFDCFFRRGLPGDVLRLWSEMGKHELVPEVEHYSVLVEGLAKCGWLNKAREFHQEMKGRGFSDDPKLDKILRPVGKGRRASHPDMRRDDAHIY